MKPRSALTATEVTELHEFLDRKLERIGVPSRPEVALRLLDLSADSNSQMKDYAAVLRTDQAMSGRVLRLANSALFGQRTPVSSLDRACLVLGLERIKALSLGVQLSIAAAGRGDQTICREVWGESVFRACMGSEAARVTAPGLVPEAFVTCLMLDAGIPLMPRLVGDNYAQLYHEARTPGALFRRESETLGFTHVDVASVMTRRWRMPELLTSPIAWHHTRPADTRRTEPVHRLHRIVYGVGLLELGIVDPQTGARTVDAQGGNGSATAQRIMGITPEDAAQVLTRARDEYAATIELFAGVAVALSDIESLVERVGAGLVQAVDDGVEGSLAAELSKGPTRLTVGGQSVEVRRLEDGSLVAYLYDSHGQRLLAHRFGGADLDTADLEEAFGLDLSDPAERERLLSFVHKQAA